MFQIVASNKFLKDLKLLKKRNKADFDLMETFITELAISGHAGVDMKHKPHKLKGEFYGYWECHVKPDLLLIWAEDSEILLLELVRTGTHSDLF